MIGAKVLNIARQDYDPQGASVTFLIAEGSMIPIGGDAVGSRNYMLDDDGQSEGIVRYAAPYH